MPQNSEDPPVFWIFGGPNGSGKSTAHGRINVAVDAPINLINALAPLLG